MPAFPTTLDQQSLALIAFQLSQMTPIEAQANLPELQRRYPSVASAWPILLANVWANGLVSGTATSPTPAFALNIAMLGNLAGTPSPIIADSVGRPKIQPRSSDWALTAAPGANLQATATKAAAVGIRQVCRAVQVFLQSAGATLSDVSFVVRDGASGVGTILFNAPMSVDATSGRFSFFTASEIYIVGTAGNAMTVEFTGAGGANISQGVNAQGLSLGAND